MQEKSTSINVNLFAKYSNFDFSTKKTLRTEKSTKTVLLKISELKKSRKTVQWQLFQYKKSTPVLAAFLKKYKKSILFLYFFKTAGNKYNKSSISVCFRVLYFGMGMDFK